MGTPVSSTVLKSFELLELFSKRRVLGASEAARLLGAPRPSTYRLLVTLEAAGVLESDERGQYHLGLRLFELGSFAPQWRRLHDSSVLPLRWLASRVRLPAHLAVRDGADLLYLEKVHDSPTEVPTHVGQRAPLHTSAPGKVLLAHAPRCVRQCYLNRPMARLTARTVVEPARLHAELDAIRDADLAHEREEGAVGYATVAARVRDMTGEVVAAISMAAPGHVPITKARSALLATAADVERRLGWREAASGSGQGSGRASGEPPRHSTPRDLDPAHTEN